MSIATTEYEAGSIDDLAREYLTGSDEEAQAYLRQWWLASAVEALVEARRHAGLTQAQLAERLGRKQPALARLERDEEGRMTLHAYVDYALACGMIPFDIQLVNHERLRTYAFYHPSEARTAVAYSGFAGQLAMEHTRGAIPANVAQGTVGTSSSVAQAAAPLLESGQLQAPYASQASAVQLHALPGGPLMTGA